LEKGLKIQTGFLFLLNRDKMTIPDVVAWNEGNDNKKYYPTSKILQKKILSRRQN
jgi:hypothetical protein